MRWPGAEFGGGEDWDGGAAFQESDRAKTVAREARIAQAAATASRHQKEAVASEAARPGILQGLAAAIPAATAERSAAREKAGLPVTRAALGVPWAQYARTLDEVAGFNGGSLAGGFNLRAVERTINEVAGLVRFAGPALVDTTYTATSMNEGGESSYEAAAAAINPELALRLNNYRVEPTADPYLSALIDPDGVRLGTFKQGDKPTSVDKIFEAVVVAAVVAMTAGAAAFALAPAAAAGAGGAGAAAVEVAPAFLFNAAIDSQAASSALGITGAEAAAAAVVPAGVNLGTLGGIMSTAPEVAAATVAKWAAENIVHKIAKKAIETVATRAVIGALSPGSGDSRSRASDPNAGAGGFGGAPIGASPADTADRAAVAPYNPLALLAFAAFALLAT